MEKIGEQGTDTLYYRPASLKIIRIRRIKYAKKNNTKDQQAAEEQKIFIAPPP